MMLTLASVGNPDYDQNPFQKLFGCEPDCTITVHSLEEASRKCLEFIKRNNLGRGNWSGGDVFDDEKNLIAKIEYTGWVIEKESS